MKRTGFKKKITKPMKRTALKAKTPLKSHTILSKTSKSRRVPKRLKSGELAKSERIRRLKKKLWPIFSKYIRKRWADHNGYLTTVDGELVHWTACDCGHLRHNTERNSLLGGNELWFYENNFAPQSNQGNRNNADDSAQKYMFWAVKTYGVKEVDKMMQMRTSYKLWTIEELEEKYKYYKEAFESL
jgi:hypothetical protein